MPAWVAALTHVVYGLTLGLLQPLGRFVPYRARRRRDARRSCARSSCVARVGLRATPAPARTVARRAAGARARRSTRATASAATARTATAGPAADDADRQAARLHQGHVQVPLDAERDAADRRGPLQDRSRRGVYRTSMPEWSLLTERERLAVIAVREGLLSRVGRSAAPGAPIVIPPPPATLGSRRSRSRAAASCTSCSSAAPATATSGRGDGPSAATLAARHLGQSAEAVRLHQGTAEERRRRRRTSTARS